MVSCWDGPLRVSVCLLFYFSLLQHAQSCYHSVLPLWWSLCVSEREFENIILKPWIRAEYLIIYSLCLWAARLQPYHLLGRIPLTWVSHFQTSVFTSLKWDCYMYTWF